MFAVYLEPCTRVAATRICGAQGRP